MGLANVVVPDAELDSEVRRWCQEILEKSPTALAIAKCSFNADTAHIGGLSLMGLQAVKLFYGTQESKEGVQAFKEKRKPDFGGTESEHLAGSVASKCLFSCCPELLGV